MKKLKKLSVLALLAVGFALVFGGCSNGSSDDDNKTNPNPTPTETPDPDDDETKTEQGSGGDGTDKGDDSDKKEDEEEKDPASSEKTGIIIGDKVYAFADLEDEGILLSTEDWNEDYGIEKLDGTDVLRLSVGSYKSYTITFKSALDLSNKKIVVSYKTDAEYEDKEGDPQDKVVLRKDANTASEVAYSFINKTSDWTSKELNVKDAKLSQAVWSKDGSIKPLEDATAVKEIALALQDEAGTVYIRSISIVDVD